MKLDNIRPVNIIFVIILGALIGLAVFRLAADGKLPIKFGNQPAPYIQGSNTKIVVSEENAVISAVDKTSPSVVAIGVNQRIVNPFDPFAIPKNQQSTIGTGFIVSDQGIIVTNKHVVSDSNVKYTVVTKVCKKLDVIKIYRDPNQDLAIVKVNSTNGSKPLELGDSGKLKVGQLAIAIGNALGRFDNTVTTGVVSGLGRSVAAGDPFGGNTEQLNNLIQTDAAINPGNSGGPLLNSSGQVIGVNVATTEGAQNIGFAIPIDTVKKLVEDFAKNGTVSRPYLGVRYRVITRDIALLNQVPQGAYIQEVIPDSPADKTKIQPGDIITKIDGQTIDNENKVSDVIASKKVGQTVTLEVWSDSGDAGNNNTPPVGKTRTVIATLAESPNQ